MDETKTIRIVVDASRAVDGSAAATRALANLDKQTAAMSSTLDRMEAALGRVGGFLKAQLALYAAELGANLLRMGSDALQAAAGLDELAEQLGITASGLQALQLSAVQNGVKLEQLESGISKFSQKMGEAAGGSKEMIDALNNIGVKILDANGKLRPTEALLQNVATAMLAIEDPARRSAAMVDFFGKTGIRMLPMLKDMAGGLDSMADAAKRAGAMISAETIAKLDKLSDSAERAKLQTRALFAENLAGPLTDGLNLFERKIANVSALLRSARSDVVAFFSLVQNPGAYLMRAVGPSEEDQLRTNLGVSDRKVDTMLKERAGFKDPTVTAEYDKLIAKERAKGATFQAGLDRIDAQIGKNIGVQDFAPDVNNYGSTNPTITGGKSGGGKESPGGKYAKLTDDLDAAAKAQDAMTKAAERGGVALRDAEVHADALAKAVDIFGVSISDADPKVAEIEKRLRAIAEGKAAQAFAAGTAELRQQNEVLEAQNRLTNEAPDIQAREIALIKTKHEALKDGIALDSDRYKARLAEVELNERLKGQADQLRQANELWTEPLRSALSSIQSASADAFDAMLQSGTISFRSLGDVFKTTIRQMVAQLLALTFIRPVLSVVVNAIGPGGVGLIGGQTAAQLGFPADAGGGLGGSGGGLGSLFSSGGAAGGGWIGRQFASASSFLQQPLYGFNGAVNTSTPAAAASMNGSAGAGLGGGGIFSGAGPSIGQGIGGALSIGMGAYGLLKGGGSTASTIGNIGQIAGGIITMLPIPGAQIVGPIVSLLSSVVPGLFGDGPKIPPQPALAYGAGQFRSTGAGGYTYGGDSLGSGTPMNDAARSIATSLQRSFRAAGLSAVPGALIGGNIASGMDHVLQGGQWQDRAYTQAGLILPGGGYEALSYNDSSRTPEQAGEYLLAQAFKANVLRGGVSGAGAGLRAGLQTINPTTSADLDRVVSLGTAYDRLGKAINPAKEAIDQINASFDDLKSFAEEANLAMGPINEELKKQSTRSAQDFIDAMLDPLAVAQRALADERESALESARYIRDNFRDVHVDMDRIATYYTNKEAALRDQFYQGAVTNLQALIDRLTYGDLANASPTLQLSGTRAAYNAALAQARAGDATAITNLSGYAESYLNVSRQSFASSPEYQALVEQIRAALQEVQISVTGGASTATASGQQTATGQSMAQLQAMVADLAGQVASRDARIDQLVDLMQRIATNRAA